MDKPKEQISVPDVLINLYFMRHGRSCGNLVDDYSTAAIALTPLIKNPPLSQVGVEQASKVNLNMINDLDFIGTSHLIRAFETAVDAMINSRIIGKLYVLPYVTEQRTPYVLGLDKTNEPDIVKLKELTKTNYKDWLNKNKIVPMFNIFDTVEKENPHLNINESNYDYFIKYVLPLIIKEIQTVDPNKKVLNIVIVSHGNFIKKHVIDSHKLVFKDHVNNTEIWKESLKLTKNGVVYQDFNTKCKDEEIAAKTCSKSAQKIYDGKDNTEENAKEKFNYCFDKMQKQGTMSKLSQLILPYGLGEHMDKKGKSGTKEVKKEVKVPEPAKEKSKEVKEPTKSTDKTTEEAKKVTEEAKKTTDEAKKATEEAKRATEEANKKTQEINKKIEEAKKAAEQIKKEGNKKIEEIKKNIQEAVKDVKKETPENTKSTKDKMNDTFEQIGKTVTETSKKAADSVNKWLKDISISSEEPKPKENQKGGDDDDKKYEVKYKKYKKKYMQLKY